MTFQQKPGRDTILITGVTEEEYDHMYELIDTEFQLLNYPVAFPSRMGSKYATIFLQGGMGCSSGRWISEYLPRIKELYGEDRIIYSGSWKDEEY